MADKLQIMLELERRGELPSDKVNILNELRKRGEISKLETAEQEPKPAPVAPEPDLPQPLGNIVRSQEIMTTDKPSTIPWYSEATSRAVEKALTPAPSLTEDVGFIPATGISAPKEVSLSDFLPSAPKMPTSTKEATDILFKGTLPGMIGYGGLEALGRLGSAGEILTQEMEGEGPVDWSRVGRGLAGTETASFLDTAVKAVGGRPIAEYEQTPLREILASFVSPTEILMGAGLGKAMKTGEAIADSISLGKQADRALKTASDAATFAEEADRALRVGRQRRLEDLLKRKKEVEEGVRTRVAAKSELKQRAKELDDLLLRRDELVEEKKSLEALKAEAEADVGTPGLVKTEQTPAGRSVAEDAERRISEIDLELYGSKPMAGTVKAKKGGATSGEALPQAGLVEKIQVLADPNVGRLKQLERLATKQEKPKLTPYTARQTGTVKYDPMIHGKSYVDDTAKQVDELDDATKVKIGDEITTLRQYTREEEMVANEMKKAQRMGSSSILDAGRKAIMKLGGGPILNVRNAMRAVGGDAGEEIVIRNIAKANLERELLGNTHADYKAIANSVDDKDWETAVRVYLGDKQPHELPVKAIGLPQKIGNFLSSIGNMAKEAELTTKMLDGSIEEFAFLDRYFPRTWSKEERVAIYKSLYGAETEKDAKEILKQYFTGHGQVSEYLRRYIKLRSEQRTPHQRQRLLNLTLEQFRKAGLKEPRLDKAVIEDYINVMMPRIASAKVYGKQNEKLTDLLTKIQTEGGNDAYRYASGLVDDMTGIDRKSVFDRGGPINGLRTLNVFRLGPQTSLIQLQQVFASAAVGSTKSFLRALRKAATPGSGDEILRIGTSLKGSADEYKKMYGLDTAMQSQIEKMAEGYLKLVGVEGIDGFARKIAGLTGMERADELFNLLKKNKNNKEARRFFDDFGFGIDVDAALARGTLTDFEKRTIGRMFDKNINFWMLTTDIPTIFRNETGKFLFQFMPQAYAQSLLIKNVILKEAMKGNVLPAVKYALLAEIGGEAYGDINDALGIRNPWNNEYRPKETAARIADNILNQGGSLGIISNLLSIPEQLLRPDEGSRVFETMPIGGPTLAIGESIWKTLGYASEGEYKKALREGLRIPTPITPAIVTKPLRGLLREDKNNKRNTYGL